ncbi:hypothetical protein IFM89_008801 [Coptis chinensis]|uniref:F-box domain-containing protein n=1 Tax=Coptis chinensis TaxID=261450 RepID=A0A835LIB3_9MAGN|nr:hypothetical protein IFM89_008801 [Coptis chinensis]
MKMVKSNYSRNSKAKKLKISTNEDRISSLPNNLIHEILSFLDMKHAARTSILSTRWRDLWTSIPTLNFNSTVFLESTRKTSKDKDRFIDFIDQRVYSWVVALVRRNVQELVIDIPASLHYLLSVPLCLFNCASLTVLKLQFERLYVPLALPHFISLPLLLTLHLKSVNFLDEDLTSKLFSSCPVLESLVIVDCRFGKMKKLIISGLKLKHLMIETGRYENLSFYKQFYCKITIFAPNLVSLRLKDHLGRDYVIEDLSFLVTADIDMENEMMVEMDHSTAMIPAEVKNEYAECVVRCWKAVCNVRCTNSCIGQDVKARVPLSSINMLYLHFLFSGTDEVSVVITYKQVSSIYLFTFCKVVSNPPVALVEALSLQFRNLKHLKLITWLSGDCICGITYLLNICPKLESININIIKREVYSHDGDRGIILSSITSKYEGTGLTLQCMYYLKYVEIQGLGSPTRLEKTSAVNELTELKHEVEALRGQLAAANAYGERCKTSTLQAKEAYLAIRAEVEELERKMDDLQEERNAGAGRSSKVAGRQKEAASFSVGRATLPHWFDE